MVMRPSLVSRYTVFCGSAAGACATAGARPANTSARMAMKRFMVVSLDRCGAEPFERLLQVHSSGRRGWLRASPFNSCGVNVFRSKRSSAPLELLLELILDGRRDEPRDIAAHG